MAIRLTRDLCVLVYNYDAETDQDDCVLRTFRTGETLRVGEVSSDDDGSAVIELVNIGYVEFPAGSWEEASERVFQLFVDRDSMN